MRSSDTRRRLEDILEFELKQLQLLERQVAKRPLSDPVQLANWTALLKSHERAIAYYRARLADLGEDEAR